MFYELASLSVRNLMRARSRLLMTAGGVMIGTTAVVLLIALTIGLQNAAEASIGNSASLTEITIRSGFRRSSSTSPTLDLDAVTQLAALPNVAAVIPMLSLGGFAELRSGNLRGAAQIYGIYPATLPYLGATAQTGELNLDDNNPYGAVFGGSVASSFVSSDATTFSTQTIDLSTQSFELRLYTQGSNSYRKIPVTITGIMDTGTAFDSALFLPMSTVINLSERMSGSTLDPDTMTFSQIIVQASSRETAADVLTSITDLGYNATGEGSYLAQLNSFFGTLRLILGGVGGVAMLVAAFGVANTMTMAILERTHEIGLMKAVGATDQAVLTIFLIEAGLVGLLGGTAGLAFSYLLQNIANNLLSNLSSSQLSSLISVNLSASSGPLISIPGDLALFALVLATMIGVCAGLYPAYRAARMTTVLALKSD
ncbi:MAG TPA: ABC transporter permease [Phototrophicaceae bacterium]|nr:ABC transporter permease [Phototrophicaceae bacterium]